MKIINQYSKWIPYFYFISVVAYWFTDANREIGILAYPILLFGIPFLWQLIKPSKALNFTLGITFVCLSSYIIIAYLSDVFQIASIYSFQKFVIYGGLFVLLNFVMSIWMVRNSLNKKF